MSDAQLVWNRACMSDTALLRVGDRHLSALLRVHGMVMNGGAGHAVETCTAPELLASVDAARYFGLGDLANVLYGISQLPTVADDDERETLAEGLDQIYEDEVPADSIIDAAFGKKLRAAPEDFAPPTAPSSASD
jgi:hypothetical protein